MNRRTATLDAFLAGLGSAFAMFPTGQMEPFLSRQPVEARIHNNFERVGKLLDEAMSKERNAQGHQAER
ncbi:hypothetical protein [Solilutibacter pythonis]|uniref:hypothetical protein n=1 Tax=Solilutibacter pythonis TaxID=2483112 RepID=UPI001314CDD7|nr:hypothetical protein [Lysobacter pythonis]